MKLRLFLYILLSFCSVKGTERYNCEENESCSLSDGNEGIVKLASDCKSFKKLKNKTPCGFQHLMPLVCCFHESSERINLFESSQTRFTPKSVEECRKFGKRPEDSNEVTQRVVGGQRCDVGEFPHYASLGYRNDEDDGVTFDCGGALISGNFVLTAAHCCKSTRKPKIVRLGKVKSFKIAKIALKAQRVFQTSANIADPEDPYFHTDVAVKVIKKFS